MFVGASLLSFYQAKILGSFVVNLGVAALVVGLLYAFLRKYFSIFEGAAPWVYLGLGLGVFWMGSYGGLGTSFGGIFQSLGGQSASVIPLAVIDGVSIDGISVGILALVGLLAFLLAYHYGFTDYEGI